MAGLTERSTDWMNEHQVASFSAQRPRRQSPRRNTSSSLCDASLPTGDSGFLIPDRCVVQKRPHVSQPQILPCRLVTSMTSLAACMSVTTLPALVFVFATLLFSPALFYGLGGGFPR